MFYTSIICSLGLRKLIPVYVHIVIKKEKEETPLDLFYSCLKTKQLWNKLRQYSQFINIPHSIPQSSILGLFDNNQHLELIINYLLLIFIFFIYSARNTNQLNADNLKITIKKIKEIEKELNSSNKLKLLKKGHLLII